MIHAETEEANILVLQCSANMVVFSGWSHAGDDTGWDSGDLGTICLYVLDVNPVIESISCLISFS